MLRQHWFGMCFLSPSNQKRIGNSLYSRETNSNIHWQFCLRAMLTLLPSVTVWSDLNCMYIPLKIILIHRNIDDIILIGQNEQEVTTKLETLVRHTHSKGWKINPLRVQGKATSVTFTGVQWSRVYLDILSKVKDKLLHLASLTTKKETWLPFLDSGGPDSRWCGRQPALYGAWSRKENCSNFGLQYKQPCHLAYVIC